MDEVQERFIDTSFPNLIQETSQNAPVEAVTDLPGAHIPLLPPPPPYGYRVEGAGTTEADGLYVRDGEYCGAPLFKKGRLWLFRYRMHNSGQIFWFLAHEEAMRARDVGHTLPAGTDSQLYCARSNKLLPPLGRRGRSGWAVARDGAAPAPRLTAVEVETGQFTSTAGTAPAASVKASQLSGAHIQSRNPSSPRRLARRCR